MYCDGFEDETSVSIYVNTHIKVFVGDCFFYVLVTNNKCLIICKANKIISHETSKYLAHAPCLLSKSSESRYYNE